jgi:hypothetical protein
MPIPAVIEASRSIGTRVTPGALCLSNSSHFAPMPYSHEVKVMLPKGERRMKVTLLPLMAASLGALTGSAFAQSPPLAQEGICHALIKNRKEIVLMRSALIAAKESEAEHQIQHKLKRESQRLAQDFYNLLKPGTITDFIGTVLSLTEDRDDEVILKVKICSGLITTTYYRNFVHPSEAARIVKKTDDNRVILKELSDNDNVKLSGNIFDEDLTSGREELCKPSPECYEYPENYPRRIRVFLTKLIKIKL